MTERKDNPRPAPVDRSDSPAKKPIMSYSLWMVQVLLALLFLFAGGVKLILPPEALAGPVPLPVLFLRFIGLCEVLGGLGLILPGLLRIRPGLTPLAAAGLVIIMIGATVITVIGGGVAPALMPLAAGLLSAFVAYGRWQVVPHRARTASHKAETSREKPITIFGKRPSEYVAFAKPFLGLILLVGIARLALSLGGVSNSTARWLSITAAIWIGVVYYAIRVHTTGFGSYKQLLPICFLMSLTAQVIIVPAIVLAIFTGTDNIYSIPENFFGNDGKTWLHVAGHLFIGGTTLGPLMGWLFGCVIMFATRKLSGGSKETREAARA